MSNKIDFNNMSLQDIRNLDYNDPRLLEYLGIDPVPEFDADDDIDEDMQCLFYRMHYMKCMIMSAVFEYHREMAFDKLKELQQIPSKKGIGKPISKKKCKFEKIDSDFTTITLPQIKELEIGNPYLLKSLGINPEEFDLPHGLSHTAKYNFYKSMYVKILIMCGIVEMQRQTAFARLNTLCPDMIKEMHLDD